MRLAVRWQTNRRRCPGRLSSSSIACAVGARDNRIPTLRARASCRLAPCSIPRFPLGGLTVTCSPGRAEREDSLTQLATGTAAARMAIRLTILVGFALLPALRATLPTSAAPANGPAVASVDAWVNSQEVVRCFPELYSQKLLFGPRLNPLREDIRWQIGVPPSLQSHAINEGKFVKLYAGYDDRTKTAVVMRDAPGFSDQLVLADATLPPAVVSHGPLHVALNGEIRLGSSRNRIENYLSAYLLHPGALIRKSRCGLVAVQYESDYVGHVFVFKSDSLIAYFTFAGA